MNAFRSDQEPCGRMQIADFELVADVGMITEFTVRGGRFEVMVVAGVAPLAKSFRKAALVPTEREQVVRSPRFPTHCTRPEVGLNWL